MHFPLDMSIFFHKFDLLGEGWVGGWVMNQTEEII